MVDGEKMRMGGREWVVPPLNLKQIRRLAPRLAQLGAVSVGTSAEQIDIIVEVVHAALTRNYPDITLEQVEEMLDLGNANDAILVIMGMSGLSKKGEAQAGSQSTGETSTEPSQPAPDGPTPPLTT